MQYQRVTEVLQPFTGIKYIEKTILENAAVRGTKVHKICEGIVNGIDEWNIQEEYKGYVESFKKWWNLGHEVISSEERFYCDDLKITGQVDLIIKKRDKAIVIDLKTSMNESKSWMLQGSAYSYLAKKKGYPVKDILFIRLRRDGSEPKYHLYEENIELFKDCLNVYRYFYG